MEPYSFYETGIIPTYFIRLSPGMIQMKTYVDRRVTYMSEDELEDFVIEHAKYPLEQIIFNELGRTLSYDRSVWKILISKFYIMEW